LAREASPKLAAPLGAALFRIHLSSRISWRKKTLRDGVSYEKLRLGSSREKSFVMRFLAHGAEQHLYL
jgi:hypothetical protein